MNIVNVHYYFRHFVLVPIYKQTFEMTALTDEQRARIEANRVSIVPSTECFKYT